ncbi:hypothetical protein CRE_31312 [Caenorhabditis remanei]|uniref:Uncharacterized protein n=1 Tax=Caenorhabditis remanei TaxID=31234 RepID=E3MLT1_CAERE|nr:hypothetical protein CRE_31312 [Caenorhabditis remanei]
MSPESNLNLCLENLLRVYCASFSNTYKKKMKSLGAEFEGDKTAMRKSIFEGYFDPKSRNPVIRFFSNKISPCLMLSLRVQVVRLYAFDRKMFYKDGSEPIILPKEILKNLTKKEIKQLLQNHIVRQDESEGLQALAEQAVEVQQQEENFTREEALLNELIDTIKEFHKLKKNNRLKYGINTQFNNRY